jgi:UDP-N-acetylglucosamine 2-epimerase (non-hydrolysing)
MQRPIALIVGTRPEAIKMAPLYFALKKAGMPVVFCSTAQHTNLLTDVLNLFNITPDINLQIMKDGQDLFHITTAVLEKIKEYFMQVQPSLVLVQGDTTTTMAGALAAYYLKIPVGHVEAGLRTGDMYNPFPEEGNRKIISALAQYHFCPTKNAFDNLLREGIAQENCFVSGNTVVDALRLVTERYTHDAHMIAPALRAQVAQTQLNAKKIIVLTTHRRESFGKEIRSIFNAIKNYALAHPDVAFFYPAHPNPEVVAALHDVQLDQCSNIYISEALSYSSMVYLLSHADGVATDSGGICEEATSLGKRILILRKKTERLESIECGLAQLVGTDETAITEGLDAITHITPGATPTAVYGDGYAAEKIVQCINHHTRSL